MIGEKLNKAIGCGIVNPEISRLDTEVDELINCLDYAKDEDTVKAFATLAYDLFKGYSIDELITNLTKRNQTIPIARFKKALDLIRRDKMNEEILPDLGLEIGDKVECFGVEGEISFISNYSDPPPVAVRFKNGEFLKWFLPDGRLESWNKETSLKLIEKKINPKKKEYKMENKTKREILLKTFFNQAISLTRTQTTNVINEYIRETKKLDHVNNFPVQLTIENGKCVHIEISTGYRHQYRVVTWYNHYMTQRHIKDYVNEIFKRDTTEHKNISKQKKRA